MTLKKTFSRPLGAFLLLSAVGASLTSAAEVSFSKVFQGTGTYDLQSNKINITSETTGSNFKFHTQNFSDPNFSGEGNNIEGKMTYTKPDGGVGTVTGITGVLSRRASDGSTPIAYYFVTPDGKAYLMVIPGHENDEVFLGEGTIQTNSSGIRDSLNKLLIEQVLAMGGTN